MDQFSVIEAIFNDALKIRTAQELERFLDERCPQIEMRRQVEQLLAVDAKAGRFLADPPKELAIASLDSEAKIGEHIGPYRIREQIGEGGMGVVYVAEQTEPVQRKVAIKIIKPGMDTKEVIARFEAERQALAFMEHPNIARVLDAGATESGRSYFVMELVRGIPITEYCDQVKATPRERLDLFQTVCDAVQHAHQKGIIHRDIKPSNVLVTQVSAKPVVKVIDFGLAKAVSGQRLTDKTLYTGFMKLMGTPAYMSPEQAGLSGLDVDTRSDIYSLGVLLYELLTGTTPLDKTEIQRQTHDEICRQVREVDAPKPSTRFSTLNDSERSTVAEQRRIEPRELRQLLDGDLDRVVLKAIEKDRDRRYGSPQDLAADVERFLEDRPVLAVAPSQWYLAQKYIRRHKVAILTAAVIMCMLLLTTVISTWQAIQVSKANAEATSERNAARQAEGDAIKSKDDAQQAQREAIASEKQAQELAEARRRLLYAANMQLADQIWNRPSGAMAEIQELLVKWIPVNAESDLREFAWRYQWSRLHNSSKHTLQDIRDMAFSPQDDLLIADATGLKKWNKINNSFEQCWTSDGAGPKHAALSPCGRWAAISSSDEVRLIDVAKGSVIHEATAGNVTFSVDGEYVLVRPPDEGWGPSGELIHLHSGERKQLPAELMDFAALADDTNLARNMQVLDTIGPDAQSFVLHERDHISLYLSGQAEPHSWQYRGYLNTAVISSNGQLFADGQDYGGVHVRLVQQPDTFVELPAPGLDVKAIAFSSDSKRIALGGDKGVITVWDIANLYERARSSSVEGDLESPILLRSVKAHLGDISKLVYSNDGYRLVSRAVNGVVKVWDLAEESSLNAITKRAEDMFGAKLGVHYETNGAEVRVSSVNSDWHKVVSGAVNPGDRIVGVTNQGGYQPIDSSMDHVDVGYLMWGPRNAEITLHLESSKRDATHLATLQLLHEPNASTCDLTYILNGTSLAISDSSVGAVTFSPIGEAARRFPYRGSSVVLSPTGKLLAMDDCRHVAVWDLQHNKLLARWESRVPSSQYRADFGTLSFSPDEKYLAMGTGLRFNAVPKRSDLKVWDIASQTEVGGGPLYESQIGIVGVAFTSDGKWLLSATHDGVLRIFNTSTWALDRTLRSASHTLSLAVSPDGRTIATGGGGGAVLWDFPSGAKRHVIRNIRVHDLAFSTDGRTLVVAGMKAVVLDVATGMQLATLDGHSDFVVSAAYSPDNNSLATVDLNGNLRTWQSMSLDEIEGDPITRLALYQHGVSLNQGEQFSEAEMTLRRVLRVQQETLAEDAPELRLTRKELVKALRGQGKYPEISKQPATWHVELGDSVTLSVETSNDNAERFTHQWYFCGDPIEGATTRDLSVSNISASDLGRYHVEIGHPDYESIGVQSEGAFLVAPDGIARGGLRKDVFLNIANLSARSLSPLTELPRFPHEPDFLGSIGSFELPTDVGEEYGVRMSGLLTPPKSGNYIFYLVSDDSSQLFLSTDESPENKRSIARLFGHNRLRRGWQTLSPENISAPITLQAGKRYWVEALFLEGKVGDHFAVTWQMPDKPPPKNSDPPIPGKYLEHRLE